MYHYEVFYQFPICGTVAGGIEEINDESVQSVDEAIRATRALHPNADLQITQVTEWNESEFRKVRF